MKFRTILKRAALAIGIALFVLGPTVTLSSTHLLQISNVAFAGSGTHTPPQPPTYSSACGWSNMNACITEGIVWMFAALDKLGDVILTLVGSIFDALVDKTIVNFYTTYTSVKDAVQTTWGVFRDISNILIIGMFTFIALSIILGNNNYGQKRLIANVLVIAVLINFSLLFTEVIIDSSNFTASQFYNSAALANAGSTCTGATGIASAFSCSLGIGTLGDTSAMLNKMAADNERGMGQVITTAILNFVFLIATAMVLGYGCFILVSRGVMLIFLLLTSSLAFATHLIPSLESKGWTRWWSALINSAVLAPLLMLLLWATLKVATKLHQTGSLGVLTSTTTAAPTAGSLSIVFSYLIILGLLYMSFKISSDFASSIGGLGSINGALTRLTKLTAGSTLAMGAAAGALSLQKSRGGAALRDEAKHKADARGVAREMSTMDPTSALYGENLKKFNALQQKAAAANARSKQEFNLMNTALGKNLAKKTGIGNLGQTKTGGAAGQAKKIADDAYNTAAGLKLSKDEAKEVATEQLKAQREALTGQKKSAEDAAALVLSQRDALAAEKTSAEEAAKASKARAEEEMKAKVAEPRAEAENKVLEVKAKAETDSGARKQELKNLADAIAKAPAGSPEAASKMIEKTAREAAHKSALDKETARIKDAQDKLKEIDDQIAGATTAEYEDARAHVANITQRFTAVDKEYTGKRAAITAIDQKIHTLDTVGVKDQAKLVEFNSRQNVIEGAAHNAVHPLGDKTSDFSQQVVKLTRSNADKKLNFEKLREEHNRNKAIREANEAEAGLSDAPTPHT